jgi:hypothetical protein
MLVRTVSVPKVLNWQPFPTMIIRGRMNLKRVKETRYKVLESYLMKPIRGLEHQRGCRRGGAPIGGPIGGE